MYVDPNSKKQRVNMLSTHKLKNINRSSKEAQKLKSGTERGFDPRYLNPVVSGHGP